MEEHNVAKNIMENSKNKQIYPTFASAVIENYISGRVLIGELNRAALIGTESGVFVVVGDEQNKNLHSLLLEMFENSKRESKRFTLFSSSKEWDLVIKNMFDKELKQISRYSFHFNSSEFVRLSKVETLEEFSIKIIDEGIIKGSQEFHETYLKEYWGTVTNFHDKGFGYCLIHENSIASECISIFASSQFAEMDIVTHESYRGKGLGQKVAEKFILHCIEEKMIPRWDCDVNNHASINLARKLGFENPIEYSVFVRK